MTHLKYGISISQLSNKAESRGSWCMVQGYQYGALAVNDSKVAQFSLYLYPMSGVKGKLCARVSPA